MKQIILAALLASVSATATSDQYVRGHVRSDGTYVAPHVRSSPNSSTYDNYSTKGNQKPYTGQQGTVDPYKSSNPYSNQYDNQHRQR